MFPEIYTPAGLFYDNQINRILIIPNNRDTIKIYEYNTGLQLKTMITGYNFSLRATSISKINDTIMLISNKGSGNSSLILINLKNNNFLYYEFPAFDLKTIINDDVIYTATSELGPFSLPSVYIYKMQLSLDSLNLILIKKSFLDTGFVKHITKTYNDFILVLIGEPNYPSYKDKVKLYVLNTNMVELVNKYIISRNYPLAMYIDENYCYIGVITENNSYKIIIEPLSKILKTDTDTETYYHYSLSQNYPNPFNSSTTIKFTLPEMKKVTLKVYNILGQEVATILENKELQAGNYDYEFNAAGLTSGTYIYRIVAGNFIQTKKMVLIK